MEFQDKQQLNMAAKIKFITKKNFFVLQGIQGLIFNQTKYSGAGLIFARIFALAAASSHL